MTDVKESRVRTYTHLLEACLFKGLGPVNPLNHAEGYSGLCTFFFSFSFSEGTIRDGPLYYVLYQLLPMWNWGVTSILKTSDSHVLQAIYRLKVVLSL